MIVSHSSLDNACVSLSSIAEGTQRGLVARALVCGDGSLDAAELDDHGSLVDARFEHPCRLASSQETAARLADDRSRELYVRGELLRIANGAKRVDPIRVGAIPPP